MNYKIIRYVMGIVLCFGALFMLLPCLMALYYHEQDGFTFLYCAAGTAVIGLALSGKKTKNTTLFAREGLVIVSVSWILLSCIGAIPYLATGSIKKPIDALFESVSGFTTTGASILSDVESLSHCVQFWRCFTPWIGGMGVLVFIMAVLPYLGASNLYIMKAESTGPSVEKLVPKMQNTAFLLYAMYTGLTIVEFIILLIAGMPAFDALCDSLSTAGTGGFAVRNDSIASYNSAIQLIITIFMFLFGVNFKFYFLILTKKFKEAFHLEEVRWYMIIYSVVVCIIAIDLAKDAFILTGNLTESVGVSLRDSAFQVAAVMTSTGFSTVDYGGWSEFVQTLMLVVMCTGACAGSTAGGIKLSRIILYMKSIGKELEFQLHPRSIRKIKMDGKTIEHETLRSTKAFLLIYILVAIVSLLLISLDQFDFTTNFTATIAMLNDVGPGFGAAGPAENYGKFSTLSKSVMIFDMMAGRLEVVPVIVLLTPGTWKRQ